MFQENCYVVSDETQECVIVDCGAFYPEERAAISNYIRDHKLQPKHLIATHAHIDHNFGNNTIEDDFKLKPEVHGSDEMLMLNLPAQAQAFIGLKYTERVAPVGKFFDENDTIAFGTHKFSIIHTPGHTPGSVVFHCAEEGVAFTGDTLFRLSIGRTDFEFGNHADIQESLHRLATVLPPKTTILPGHGEQTTMEYEMKYNPYVK